MTVLDPARSVVRVMGPSAVAGTGFLVGSDRRLIATCAHVVGYAASGPGARVDVVFHATGGRMPAYVEPDYWRSADSEDVAFLRLDEEAPDDVPQLLLGTSTDARDHPFRSFGFPRPTGTEGLAGAGTIIDRTEVPRPRLQLSEATQVAVGFSGAPLVDTKARRVVGMLTGILLPDQGRFFDTAFGVPAETMVGICPELAISDVRPYRELSAFSEADAEFYFGRSAAVQRLLSALRRDPRFLAVLGPSGSGKSSLVRAGLLPGLRAGAIPGSEDWGILVTRPAELVAMADEVPGIHTNMLTAARAWLSGHPEAKRLVLVLDQFEEAFVALDANARGKLLATLGEAVESSSPLTLVLTMRDEFFSRFVRETPRLGRAMESGLRNVPPELARPELAEIVQAPARLLGLHFDDDLVDRIVNDAVTSYPGVEPDTAANTVLPMLEFALTQLWEGRRDGVLTHGTYERIGRVTGGIATWAEAAMDRLGEAAQPLVRRILTGLVQPGDEAQGTPDNRWRRPASALTRRPGELPDVLALIGRLADERLVITSYDQPTGETAVELIHDALLREWGRLQQWLAQDRLFLTFQQHLERQRLGWVASGPEGVRDEGMLLHGNDLKVAADSRADYGDRLRDDQIAYIEASLAAWERDQRRLQDALTEAERQRAVAESRLFAANLREQASRVLALLPLEPVAGLALAADATIRSVRGTPGEPLDAVQVSLHAALCRAREQHVAVAHTAPVAAVAASPDGQLIASAGADRTVRLWRADGTPVGTPWTGHEDAVTAVAFDPRGRYIVSAGADGTIRLWTVDGTPVGPPWTGHEDAVTSIAFDPRGEHVVSSSDDRTLRLWTVEGTPIGAPWTGHEDAVTSIAFDPRGERVASGSADRTVRLWRVSGSPVGRPWVGHEDGVTAVAFDPREDFVATAGRDRLIRLWNLRGRPIRTPLVGHREAVTTVAFVGDGGTLVSGGTDRSVRIWDRDGYAATKVVSAHSSDANGVVLFDGGQRVLTGGADGMVRAWNRAGEPAGPSWRAHDDFIYDLARDPAGRRVASASADGTVGLWDSRGVRLAPPLAGHDGTVSTVCFGPDGAMLASGGADRTVRLWRADGTPIGEPLRGHDDEVRAVAFSPNGQLLASAGFDMVVRLWRPDGTPIGEPLRGHEDEIRDLAFVPDGTALFSGSVDRTLRCWNLDGAPAIEPLHGHTGGVYAVAVSRDGAYVLSGAADHTLRLWDRRGNPVSEPFEGHQAPVWRVAIGDDGRFFASVGGDGTLRYWDGGWRAWLEQACRRLRGHPGPPGQYAPVAESVREACLTQPWRRS